MADTTEHAHEEKREYKNHGDPLEHTDDSTEPAPKHEPVPYPTTEATPNPTPPTSANTSTPTPNPPPPTSATA